MHALKQGWQAGGPIKFNKWLFGLPFFNFKKTMPVNFASESECTNFKILKSEY